VATPGTVKHKRAVADGPCRALAQWLHLAQPKESFMIALIQTLLYALDIYWWIVVLAVVFSWLFAFNVINGRNQFVSMIGNGLYQMTEPVFRQIRRLLPDLGGIDISPIIVLLLIFFLQRFLATTVLSAVI
jgi:YggT family protein